MLKIIGAGLSRTGTASLQQALQTLGLSCVHFDHARLEDVLDGSNTDPDFRRYDDVDAVVDLPAAYFYRELLAAYPASKAILTLREVHAWWKSVSVHFNVTAPVPEHPRLLHRIASKAGYTRKYDKFDAIRRRLRNYVYGSPHATEFLYKKKFVEHNALAAATIPSDRLLVMDICAGDGWEKLCPFIGAPIPSTPFPHNHRATIEPALVEH